MAGYDLEILKLLLSSPSNILMVGDLRQTTYQTNHASKNKKYWGEKIVEFFEENRSEYKIQIDKESLRNNYRSNQEICTFADKLFPQYPKTISNKKEENEYSSNKIFLVCESDIHAYLKKYLACTQLRNSKSEERTNKEYKVFNFGEAKGKTFDHVLIYPTKPMVEWLKNNTAKLEPTSRCKFYVAITRAKYTVGIVYNYRNDENIDGVRKFNAPIDVQKTRFSTLKISE